MTMAFDMLASKHTKAARSLIRFVKNKKYLDCDFKECGLLLKQLKANIILGDSWVPYYKTVEVYYQVTFKKVLESRRSNEVIQSVKEMVE